MINIAEYIAMRLQELGAEHLFCIPGNYSAEFLLAADKVGLKCVKTTNELEAGYAADAYARYRGIGACSVTYGVGSQSLYNAVAGAFVEYCPVVVINGSPPLDKVANLRDRNILFAHAIDTLRTDKFIFQPITVAWTEILSADDAGAEIDRVLQACITQRRPVYLEVHQGVWRQPCDPPVGKLSLQPPSKQDAADQEIAVKSLVKVILDRVSSAENPVIWGGEMVHRLGLAALFQQLVQKSGLPYTTTLMGKGLIPENSHPSQFIGVYDSKFCRKEIKEVVEKSDCLLALGTLMSDFYTDIVVNSEAKESLILAVGNAVRVGNPLFTHVPLEQLLPRLVEAWPSKKPATPSLPGLSELVERRSGELKRSARLTADGRDANPEPDALEAPTDLTWDSFFLRMKSFLTAEMLVLTDTGLSFFPAAELPVHRGGGFLAQTAWLSIGYTGGAALGAALAETNARPVVFVGDGGFQMVPQAFSTLVRETSQRNPPIIFVMDNGLYGIEQFLIDEQILPSGEKFYRDGAPASPFDDLERWDYAQLGQAFGGVGRNVTTLRELNEFLEEVSSLKLPALVGVRLAKNDLPRAIQAVVSPPTDAAKRTAQISSTQASPRQTVIAMAAFD